MREQQGTYPGYLLDGNRLRVYGWTEGAFTASSAAHDNLPMGFEYRANEFLTAARGAGLEKKDFAAVFHLLAQLSGVTA